MRRRARGAVGVALVAAAAASAMTAGAQTVTVSGTSVQMPRPQGYIGIVYSGEQRVQTSQHRHNDEVVEHKVLVSYANYPVIVSVEPGSPAARAGLQAGDTVLSYNGRDVKEPFPLHDMLKPGSRINMRVRRGGVRSVAVTVGQRPAAFGPAGTAAGAVYVTPDVSEQVRREVERAQDHARRELEQARREASKTRELTARREAPTRPGRVNPATTARASVAPLVFTNTTLSGVAGAEMVPLNDDLADLVGLRRGVFVVKVNPGTPADQSGLKGGDVITAVGDSMVHDLAQLRRAINAEQRRIRASGSAREIPVKIVRKHRRQKVTLRF